MVAIAVNVANLVKRYPSAVAVDGIDFAVARGVTAALLGGNGAGKTTTLSILLGLCCRPPGRWRFLARTCCATATGCCRGSIFPRRLSICRIA